MHWKCLIGLFAAAALALGQSTPAAEDIAAGKRVYDSQCALCHGIGGTGGRGPALTLPKLRHAEDLADLVKLIVNGIDGSGMPAFWFLGEGPVTQVAASVKSLGAGSETATLPGNVEHGKSVYVANGCVGCHVAGGVGSAYGPELTDIGARRSATFLRDAILDPEAAIPEGFVMVHATPRNGKVISGVRLNEDSFTIQLRDQAGRFYSFRKQDLADVKKDFGKSPMPAYRGRLSDSDLDDLVAWLASLRGKQ
jgi:cytochrome c oxidase cbb3-type subunit 3